MNEKRRQYILASLASSFSYVLASPEEKLSADVASLMKQGVASVNPPKLMFYDKELGENWLNEMSRRLAVFIDSPEYRRRLLTIVHYESTRAGLDSQLVLALIEVESAFRQYAISSVGAKGLMQIMPFWQKIIGQPHHNLFDIHTNIRYGCTILRHYLNVEKQQIHRALARYNGSLGRLHYPNAIMARYHKRWTYHF